MKPLPSTWRHHWFWRHLKHFSYVLMGFIFYFYFFDVLMLVVFLWDGFFLDVLMLIVSCEMGFFLGCTYVGCFLSEDCDFSFFFFFCCKMFGVFFPWETLEFSKNFLSFFFKDKHRNMTKGLSWWEMWKRRVFWSLY